MGKNVMIDVYFQEVLNFDDIKKFLAYVFRISAKEVFVRDIASHEVNNPFLESCLCLGEVWTIKGDVKTALSIWRIEIDLNIFIIRAKEFCNTHKYTIYIPIGNLDKFYRIEPMKDLEEVRIDESIDNDLIYSFYSHKD